MIHILVSFNKNYIKPFHVLVESILHNNPNEQFHFWLLHSSVETKDLLAPFDPNLVQITPIKVDSKLFDEAHITSRYPQEMYYRLLSPLFLPTHLDKILYLDPDILVINSLKPLWEMDLEGNTFGAASHTGLVDIMNPINRIRLQTDHDYYNTGVMLIDLNKARELIDSDEIFKIVNEKGIELLLPDQDVFNHLYGKYTLDLDETLYNYDARYYQQYRLRSNGEHDLNWVIKNTVVLHFCGKNKPWHKNYTSKFASLYKHYMHKLNYLD